MSVHLRNYVAQLATHFQAALVDITNLKEAQAEMKDEIRSLKAEIADLGEDAQKNCDIPLPDLSGMISTPLPGFKPLPESSVALPSLLPFATPPSPPSKSRQKSDSRPKKSRIDEITDEDSDVDQDIDSIQNQLQDMAAKLAALVAKKEKKKATKKSSTGQVTTTPKSKAGNAPKARKPRSGPPKPRTKKTPGDASQQKRVRSDDVEEITCEQKQELAEKINSLDEDKLSVVADIIRASMPHLTEEKEIELDIEKLDRLTLFKLYQFVNANATPSLPTSMEDVKRQKLGDDLRGKDQYNTATKLAETGYLSSINSSGSESGTDSDSGSSSD